MLVFPYEVRILFDPYPPLKLTAKDAKTPCKIDAWTMKYMKFIVGMLSFSNAKY